MCVNLNIIISRLKKIFTGLKIPINKDNKEVF